MMILSPFGLTLLPFTRNQSNSDPWKVGWGFGERLSFPIENKNLFKEKGSFSQGRIVLPGPLPCS